MSESESNLTDAIISRKLTIWRSKPNVSNKAWPSTKISFWIWIKKSIQFTKIRYTSINKIHNEFQICKHSSAINGHTRRIWWMNQLLILKKIIWELKQNVMNYLMNYSKKLHPKYSSTSRTNTTSDTLQTLGCKISRVPGARF